MLTIDKLINILNSYNINSKNYGPTIYKNNNDIGICLDIKDSTFSYLTRVFSFNSEAEVKNFLNKYYWYQDNYKKYNIELKFDKYDVKNPSLSYSYKNIKLLYDDMVNLDNIVDQDNNIDIIPTKKNILIANIESLNDYLIELKGQKEKNQKEKNNLKVKENDLKHKLLKELTNYYGGNKVPDKKNINIEDLILNRNDELFFSIKNLEEKSEKELEELLNNIINKIKDEDLDEKNLINLYSINIYKYNIEILNKQIDFVKSKIIAEKNFNLKGSKIHNIDAELKSFLNDDKPIKIEDFISEKKEDIINKYNLITDIEDAYKIISGKDLSIIKEKNLSKNNIVEYLKSSFNSLNDNSKISLILYDSIYKDIINYIIDNNYPTTENIIKEFNFAYYYNDLQDIVFNENNTHYLNNYFRYINFKNLDSYILSLVNMAKEIENINIKVYNRFKVFSLNLNHTYKSFSLNPTINKSNNSILEIPKNTKLLFNPSKIIIDNETSEMSLIPSNSIYIKEELIDSNDVITVNTYTKKQIKQKDITITTDLDFKRRIDYKIKYIEESL